MSEILSYLENFHIKFRLGVIDAAESERQRAVLGFYLSWPDSRAWWKKNQYLFGQPFLDVGNALIAGFEDGSIPLPDVSVSDEVPAAP